MANNITIPATGTGTATPVVATEDISSSHYQKVKLIDGTAASTTVIAAGNGTNGGALRVTVASDSTGTLGVAGTVAHDAADSGNPEKIGAKASTSVAGVTLVANSDRTDLYAGVDGVLIVRPNNGLEDIVRGLAAITDGSSTSVLAALGSGIKAYITDVIIANSSASNVTVDLRDGTGGTVLVTLPAPANAGVVHRFGTPLPFSANTAVAADPSAAATTVTVTVVGFKSKV